MKSDIEIAQGIEIKPIAEIAASLGLSGEDLVPYGRYVAKIPISVMDRYQEAPDGKVILVTAMSPTSMGEGKTTTTIGLGQALNQIGKKAVMAIREPSLGPCMGLKGGGRRRWILPGAAHGRHQPPFHRRLPRHHHSP